MLKLLEQTLKIASAADLAKAVRKLSDDDLADLVRDNDALPRFLVMAYLADWRPDTSRAAKPKPKPRKKGGGLKPKERKALEAPASNASPVRGTRKAVLKLVTDAGDQGIAVKRVAEQLGASTATASYHMRKLLKAGQLRLEGKTNRARYFAA